VEIISRKAVHEKFELLAFEEWLIPMALMVFNRGILGFSALGC